MIKTKIKALALAVLLIVGVVEFSSCRKCYNCKALVAGVMCHKNSDTVGVYTYHGKTMIDTLNYYRSIGYTCDTFGSYYTFLGTAYTNPICSKTALDYAIGLQDICEPTK